MRFIQIIIQKKMTFVVVLSFFYVLLNLLDGERGLISYYEKQKIKKDLFNERKILVAQLALMEKKNSLLTEKIDLDYLEILYREKFVVGKSKEHIYLNFNK